MVSPESMEVLNSMYPMFYNDLKFVGNPKLESLILTAIRDAVEIGELKFQQKFGGWYPRSDRFGINPLRPKHLGYLTSTTSQWVWTSGASASKKWAASDNFVTRFSLDDTQMMLIYGYFNLSPVPNTIELQFSAGNVTLPVFNVEPMRMKADPYIIFPQPILVEPMSPFAVAAACKSTSTTEEAGLLGYYFAPCATLITLA